MVAFRLTSFPIDNQSREQAYVLLILYSLENVTKAVHTSSLGASLRFADHYIRLRGVRSILKSGGQTVNSEVKVTAKLVFAPLVPCFSLL